ncbi:hypothetical protein AEM51_06815 [Bacteroidetes bacterium UKL13-3]|nr:hypothetical protein AEM51_06815 [Bacteroidetes bacterium UKL13-3]
MQIPAAIKGGSFTDSRGKLGFCNDFDMSQVKRFYLVENANTEITRAWQGHQQEQKWFYVVSGSFMVAIVKPDNWSAPSANLPVDTHIIKAHENSVLHIPGGYANGFRALEQDSKLMVFSDFTLEEGLNDNFRFDANLWFNFQQ